MNSDFGLIFLFFDTIFFETDPVKAKIFCILQEMFSNFFSLSIDFFLQMDFPHLSIGFFSSNRFSTIWCFLEKKMSLILPLAYWIWIILNEIWHSLIFDQL